MKARPHAFTLIEMCLAVAIGAVVLSALYVNYSGAMHLRDNSAERVRASRVRARAVQTIRNDLRHGLVSGGLLAKDLQGSETSQSSSFPGYLKINTTTAPDDLDQPSPDVQQIEYYLIEDASPGTHKSGILVRAVQTNLLAQTVEDPREEPLISGIASMKVEFYDGQSWQTSWAVTDTDTTLPSAVRVTLQPETAEGQHTPEPPIEIYVPWSTQAAILPAATPDPATAP